MTTTTDPTDSRLGRGVDEEPRPQQETYLVLSDEEKAKGFVRPVRTTYRHTTCGSITTMAQAIAEIYARDPQFGQARARSGESVRSLPDVGRWVEPAPAEPDHAGSRLFRIRPPDLRS